MAGLLGTTIKKPEPIKAPDFTAQDDSVENRLTNMLGTESAYMRQADRAGRTLAARRGLLNSSIAGQAAQEASIAAALPVARDDAATAAAKNMSRQNFEQDTTRDREARASTEAIAQAQIETAEAQQQAGFGFQAGENVKEREFTAGENAASRQLTAQQSQAARQLEREQGRLNRQQQTALNERNIRSNERVAAETAVARVSQTYAAEYQAIMANQDLKAADREAQIRAAQARQQTRLNAVRQLYNVRIDWPTMDADPVTGEAPAPAAGRPNPRVTAGAGGTVQNSRRPAGGTGRDQGERDTGRDRRSQNEADDRRRSREGNGR